MNFISDRLLYTWRPAVAWCCAFFQQHSKLYSKAEMQVINLICELPRHFILQALRKQTDWTRPKLCEFVGFSQTYAANGESLDTLS